ncbi:MAG: transposase [Anaerostipes hadrus]
MDEFNRDYPDIPLYLRGDSGFADIMIYETLESNGVSYAIRMKENGRLRSAASFIEDELFTKTKITRSIMPSVMANFSIKLDSWLYPRRIVCKIEKPEGQMNSLYTFIVTNMDGSPEDLICFYCKRGLMETFIRESKHGFHMDAIEQSQHDCQCE